MLFRLACAALLVAMSLGAFGTAAALGEEQTIRIGHFPNVTHVQALVARNLERQGRGWYEPRLSEGIRLLWFAYNAGPSVMEAIFAGSLDLAYVGPNPAINAHARSGGDEIRIVAGALNGGSAPWQDPVNGRSGAPSARPCARARQAG